MTAVVETCTQLSRTAIDQTQLTCQAVVGLYKATQLLPKDFPKGPGRCLGARLTLAL